MIRTPRTGALFAGAVATLADVNGDNGGGRRPEQECHGRWKQIRVLRSQTMPRQFLKLIQCVSLLSALDSSAFSQVLPKQPLALINGEAIAAEEVEKPLGVQLGKLEEQIYALKRQKLEALIQSRLLAQEAARRGLTVPALLEMEVSSKLNPVTDEEVESYR